MQIAWLEDLIALSQTQNFRRAAQLRFVTHPAFSRRIQALESWAGVSLVDRRLRPLVLTPAGTLLLERAQEILTDLGQTKRDLGLQHAATPQLISVATGRTLARTVLADWLKHMEPLLGDGLLQVHTRTLKETSAMLEAEQVHFMLAYHHPILGLKLSARLFQHLHVAQDQLVPVSRCSIAGKPQYVLSRTSKSSKTEDRAASTGVRFLSYASGLALGQIVKDHLKSLELPPRLTPYIECDSADAILEYALKGAGVAWLPWSMVTTYCQRKQLMVVGDARLSVPLEVRLYRRKRPLPKAAESFWELLKTINSR